MDLSLTDEQRELVESVRRLLADHATPERVRKAEASGFDGDLWEALSRFGAVQMAVSTDRGGWGASLLDLALVAEEIGRTVAPAPIVETATAARLISRLDGTLPTSISRVILEGEKLLTLALHPARGSHAMLVPAGSVADLAVVRRDDDLVLVELDGQPDRVANIGAMPVADIVVDNDVKVLASGAAAVAIHQLAIDEWLTLTAAALVGLSARAVEIGAAYATERRAWGRPIGSYQAIAHPFADSATAVDGARLLTYEAAWAAVDRPERHGELAAMSFAFAAETARDATYRSLHAHGGYGFMLEYDIQLYFRRARAWANVFAEPAKVYERVAVRRYGLSTAAPA